MPTGQAMARRAKGTARAPAGRVRRAAAAPDAGQEQGGLVGPLPVEVLSQAEDHDRHRYGRQTVAEEVLAVGKDDRAKAVESRTSQMAEAMPGPMVTAVQKIAVPPMAAATALESGPRGPARRAVGSDPKT